MASQPPPLRSASLADRKRSVQMRQKGRPVSMAYNSERDINDNSSVDQNATQSRRVSTMPNTVESRNDSRYVEERQVRRTRMSVNPMQSVPQAVPTPPKPNSARVEHQAHSKSLSNESSKTSAKSTTSSWNPSASLLPATTTAPLASRISVPPLALHAPNTLQPRSLATYSLAEQENVIVEDLLFVLMGFEGQYISYVEGYKPLDEKSRLMGPQFRFSRGLDPSLRDLAYGTLSVASSYCALEAFLDIMGKDECGAVSHALCSAVRKYLKEYLILIAQLESQQLTNPDFTLHQLSLHIKPTIHLMTQLYNLAQEVLKENGLLEAAEEDLDASEDFENVLENLREGRDASLPGKKSCRGGAILRLVTRRLKASAGDPAASQVLTTLLQEASRPYMRMLNEWLHHGNVYDPYNEFLIKEQKSIRREGLQQDYTDEYWEKRYTLRQDLIPPQLETVKDKVLLAGKYLNVVRECGGIANQSTDLASESELPHTLADPRVLENVSKAYSFANRSLMALLLTTHGLPARFRSIKHYFFLDRGDFFSYFLELSSSELRKASKNVNANKLQSLLDIVVRQPGSVAAEDPFKEDVKVTMSDTGLTGWLMRVVNVQGMDVDASSLSAAYTPAVRSANGKDDKEISGYEALTLDYSVPFPLSLIISRNTLTRYQLLFRYLLSLRHLEIQLTQSWTEHTKSTPWHHRHKMSAIRPELRSHVARIESWKRRAWTLRSRMLCFVQQLLYFCTSEVIEPNWSAFMLRLNECHDVDMSLQAAATETNDSVTAVDQGRLTSGVPNVAPAGQPKLKRTVDELMQDHVDFLATCLKECMLTNSKLLRINSKVMSTCSLFANYTSSLSRSLASVDPDLASVDNSGASRTAYDPSKLDKLFSILQQYEDHFSRHLKILLDALNYLAATETVVFLGLCARLSMANEGVVRDTNMPDNISNTGSYN